MWTLAGLAAAMLVAAFFGFGILVLLSLPILVVALVLSILEDRKLDVAGRRIAQDTSSKIGR